MKRRRSKPRCGSSRPQIKSPARSRAFSMNKPLPSNTERHREIPRSLVVLRIKSIDGIRALRVVDPHVASLRKQLLGRKAREPIGKPDACVETARIIGVVVEGLV